MKKLFVVLVGVMMSCAAFAQVVEKDESALVYYSPKTSIRLDFAYTVETQAKGVYAEYAEALIGAKEAVKEDKTTYTLNDVRISTTSSTDYSRPHKVVADPAIPMLLSINNKGLLVGYNYVPETPQPERKSNAPEARRECEKGTDRFVSAPYPEEVLKAATPMAQAHAAAQQIFHLRETRSYLINGEVDKAPADGTAMRLVLEELDKQERALIDLFIGKKSKRTEHKIVFFEPESQEQKWYFSEENGFTDADNIDAEAITASVIVYEQHYAKTEDEGKGKKKPVVLSSIVYNLPGSGDVKVSYQGQILSKRTVPIAQAGIDVPLAKDLFTGKELPTIQFDEKTGNIKSIIK